MSRYSFELATPADDADLRRVLAATPTPGTISVAFLREPSYFAAAAVDGRFRQVVTARDTSTGHLVGFGLRAVGARCVNGQPAAVGYLGSLRLLAEHRNQGLVARGYAYFRRLHADGRAPVYLTTIAEGNARALALLTSGRAGLPRYHPAGRYHTLAVPLVRRRYPRPTPGLEIVPAVREDRTEIVDFLRATGPARQFFPCYETADLFETDAALLGLRPEDLLLARRGGRLVGTLGAWDQSGFRQAVVCGYEGRLRWGRWLYNGWARLRGLPPLPAPGQPLRYLLAALPVVAGDDRDVMSALLEALLYRQAASGFDYLLLGAHERDPLLPELRRFAAVEYRTALFLVCWADGDALRGGLDGRAPYLELGSL